MALSKMANFMSSKTQIDYFAFFPFKDLTFNKEGCLHIPCKFHLIVSNWIAKN